MRKNIDAIHSIMKHLMPNSTNHPITFINTLTVWKKSIICEQVRTFKS